MSAVVEKIIAGDVRAVARMIRDIDDGVIYTVFTAKDITEQKRKEEEIKMAHKDLSQIFNASAPLCVIDKDYNMLRINDGFGSFFGMRRDEIIGKKCYDIWKGPLCNTPECPLDQAPL